ncbi:MAG TPA: hypothetical protein VFQ44_01065 [Streptosporangiaceae bacterium]|nr:hypothetical protein [Streptosporangiaceae bacterium]
MPQVKERTVTLLGSSVWHGKAFSSGWRETGGGEAATRWVTITGDAAPYPF